MGLLKTILASQRLDFGSNVCLYVGNFGISSILFSVWWEPSFLCSALPTIWDIVTCVTPADLFGATCVHLHPSIDFFRDIDHVRSIV